MALLAIDLYDMARAEEQMDDPMPAVPFLWWEEAMKG